MTSHRGVRLAGILLALITTTACGSVYAQGRPRYPNYPNYPSYPNYPGSRGVVCIRMSPTREGTTTAIDKGSTPRVTAIGTTSVARAGIAAAIAATTVATGRARNIVRSIAADSAPGTTSAIARGAIVTAADGGGRHESYKLQVTSYKFKVELKVPCIVAAPVAPQFVTCNL